MKNKNKLIYGGILLTTYIIILLFIEQLVVYQDKIIEIKNSKEKEQIYVTFPSNMEKCSNILIEQDNTTEEVKLIDAEVDYVAASEQILEVASEQALPQSDLRLLSAIVYAEAGNQCQAGQDAVGIVVMNRVRSSQFPNDIYNVLTQPGQFSPISNGSFAKALDMYDNGTLPQSCIDAAQTALSGSTSVVYNDEMIDLNGIYFFARYQEYPIYIIQDHQFR